MQAPSPWMVPSAWRPDGRIHGGVVRAARKTRGWSQERLAKHLLTQRSTVARWELGLTPGPRNQYSRQRITRFVLDTASHWPDAFFTQLMQEGVEITNPLTPPSRPNETPQH